MDGKQIQKLTFTINVVILLLVFGLAAFFYFVGATFLVWFSIPTALIYVLGFSFIKRDRQDIYVRMVYFWLTLYMSITTIMLGYKFGFHMYCLSMIPIIFYSEYMARQLGKVSINAKLISIVIVFCHLASTGYSAYFGPIYEVDQELAGIFWIFNSLIVLGFIIYYSSLMLKLIQDSEDKLTDMALKDRLTALYNRHYTMRKLGDLMESNIQFSLAMIDIDNFKHINDRYGHNAGDYVLKKMASIMNETCKDCTVSRWGGEEFLVFTEKKTDDDVKLLFEKLRAKVETTKFTFEEEDIKVTVTIGISERKPDLKLDKIITTADGKLYEGKNSGKNKVVF